MNKPEGEQQSRPNERKSKYLGTIKEESRNEQETTYITSKQKVAKVDKSYDDRAKLVESEYSDVNQVSQTFLKEDSINKEPRARSKLRKDGMVVRVNYEEALKYARNASFVSVDREKSFANDTSGYSFRRNKYKQIS